jgi:uncharacterized protein (DUF736 family)
VGDVITEADVVRGVRIEPAVKSSPNGPDFRIVAAMGADFGAGWNKLSAGGKAYVSCKLQGVTFNGGDPLYPILVESVQQPGTYIMAWDKRDPARALDLGPVAPSGRNAPADAAPAPGGKTKRG